MMTAGKTIKAVALILLATLPIISGGVQIAHYMSWIFGLQFDNPILFSISLYLLFVAFFVSFLERFCVYYRLTVLATFYLRFSNHILDYFPSIYSYNLSNLMAALLITIGLIGCLVHFGYQINDFIRYVRTKQQRA